MEFLNEYWGYIENIGIPIFMIIVGITMISLNFYSVESMELDKMKSEINTIGNLNNFKGLNYAKMFNPIAFFYIFSFLPNSNTHYFKHNKLNY